MYAIIWTGFLINISVVAGNQQVMVGRYRKLPTDSTVDRLLSIMGSHTKLLETVLDHMWDLCLLKVLRVHEDRNTVVCDLNWLGHWHLLCGVHCIRYLLLLPLVGLLNVVGLQELLRLLSDNVLLLGLLCLDKSWLLLNLNVLRLLDLALYYLIILPLNELSWLPLQVLDLLLST